MKAKQLAEMIKHLRNQKLEEARMPTPPHNATKGNIKRRHKLAGMSAQQNTFGGQRYQRKYQEEEKQIKTTKGKDVINNEPEQDDLKGFY